MHSPGYRGLIPRVERRVDRGRGMEVVQVRFSPGGTCTGLSLAAGN